MRTTTFAIASILLGLLTSSSLAGQAVNISIGPEPPPLVRLAADEMAGQLQKLFEAEVSITAAPTAGAEHVILLGNPTTTPTVADRVGTFWPELTDQGHLLKTIRIDGRPVLVVGGGSPVATLWAAYELGHRFGIRYLLTGDALPAAPPTFTLDNFNVVLEPALKTRGWRVMDLEPAGYGGWGIEDYRKLFKQLAKLKFNRVQLAGTLDVNSPYLPYEFKEASNANIELNRGPNIRVDGDTAGRRAFGGAKIFINPAFGNCKTNEEVFAAAIGLMRETIDAAHAVGLEVHAEIDPLVHPPCFKPSIGMELEVGTTAAFELQFAPSRDFPLKANLIAAKLNAGLELYPNLDGIAVKGFDRGEDWICPKLAAQKRAFYRQGEQLVAMSLDGLRPSRLRELRKQLLPPPQSIHVFPQQEGEDTEVQADKVQNFQRGGPGCVFQFQLGELLHHLPQSKVAQLGEVCAALTKAEWDGIVLASQPVGDHSAAAYALSRLAFEARSTTMAVMQELFQTVGGGESVAERWLKALELLESATKNELLFEPELFSGENALLHALQHPVDGASGRPKLSLAAKRDLHIKATDEFFRAHDACHPKARPILYYHCKRGEFAIHYLNFAEAMLAASEAKTKGNAEEQAAQLEKALESIYNACNSLSEVARDPSDRGTIAVLNEYGYRQVKKMIEETEGEE